MKGFKFYAILFIIGFGCICILCRSFNIGFSMFLMACLLVGIL
jgi:hypothetical protein